MAGGRRSRGLRLRNPHLQPGFPGKIVFDETYYAKDAWGLLHSGYERQWLDTKQFGTDDKIAAGDLSGFTDNPAYVVHPPLGKWLIAIGEYFFGMTPFGWRFMSCVFGALLVFLTVRMARRLSRSTLVGAIAGVLLTFDGLAFTMSRIALLDIFQATFVLAAVAALIADRDWFRSHLARYLRTNNMESLQGAYGPLALLRPWRLVAGVMFGAACAVKWNSIYVVAVFGVLTVAWDIGARRLAGAGRRLNVTWLTWATASALMICATIVIGSRAGFPQAALLVGAVGGLILYAHVLGLWRSLLGDAPMAFLSTVVLAIPVYLASWTGWLTTSGGYLRDWARSTRTTPSCGSWDRTWGHCGTITCPPTRSTPARP